MIIVILAIIAVLLPVAAAVLCWLFFLKNVPGETDPNKI